jgi:hypothetical protein
MGSSLRRLTDTLRVAALIGLSVAGCFESSAPSSESTSRLSASPSEVLGEAPIEVDNQTQLAVSLFVNAAKVETFLPHTGGKIDVSLLPGLPWAVRATTSTGRILAEMHVKGGDVQTRRDGESVHLRGDAVRVDLSCGRLDIWVGPPIIGPMPGPGRPGDCVP